MDSSSQRYLSDTYLERNPTWDQEDSPWKAEQVWQALQRGGRLPTRLAEVGCGAGGVLAELRKHLPDTHLSGFDIAPAASRFWAQHEGLGINFQVGDFLRSDGPRHEVILLLDVIEHLEDPFAFLRQIRDRADQVILIIPLDLSAISVLREAPLMHVRDKVGHLHYFTKSLALALLEECGFAVTDWRYSNAAISGPGMSWKTRMIAPVRWLFYRINHDLGARLLGGETLIVTARPAA
jgi:SAM-dependent methyltransferase